jgi:hypothetical protein
VYRETQAATPSLTRRTPAKPRPAKPSAMSAQVDGSGTPEPVVMLLKAAQNWFEPQPSASDTASGIP